MKKQITFLFALFPFFLSAQPSPDFTFIEATDGQEYTLYEDFLDQGKTVVLDVFFTSCPPCNAAAPYLEPLYREWGAGYLDVEFIALSDKSFDSNQDVADYQVSKGHSFLGAGYDGLGQDAANLFKSGTYGFWIGTPTYIVISPDGTVNFDVRGNNTSHTFALLDAAIEATGASRAVRATGNVLFNGSGIGQADVFLDGAESDAVHTDDAGNFTLNDIILPNENYVLRVEKNINPSNGVSTADMIIMLKHILNIEPFSSPLQYIAADINQSNSITTLDLLQLRKLILQIDTDFSDNTSWRFMPSGTTFDHPNSPFDEFDAIEANGYPFTSEDDISSIQIQGVKIGDLNFSANPNELLVADDRFQDDLLLNTNHQIFDKNEFIQVNIRNTSPQTILGYQMALEFDTDYLELVRVTEGDLKGFDLENFNLEQSPKGVISTNWLDSKNTSIAKNKALFALVFKTKQAGQLEHLLNISTTTSAEAYDVNLNTMNMTLQFVSPPDDLKVNTYPNPTIANVQLSYGLSHESSVDIQLIDMNGRVLKNIDLGLQYQGQQQINLDLKNIEQGLYFIKINKNNEALETVRIIKQ